MTVGVHPAESSQTHPAEILLTRRTGHLITAVHLLHTQEKREHFQSMHRVIQVQKTHREQTFAQHVRFQFAEGSHNLSLKGSYDVAKNNIIWCIWCNAMCLCSLRFIKHIIFHILYIIVAPLCSVFLKRVDFYKLIVLRSEACSDWPAVIGRIPQA